LKNHYDQSIKTDEPTTKKKRTLKKCRKSKFYFLAILSIILFFTLGINLEKRLNLGLTPTNGRIEKNGSQKDE
jgi:hypothetical protein